jgi:hypothetical protein
MAKATKAEKRALKRVIFEPTRLRAIVDDLRNVDVLMGMRDDSTAPPPFVLVNGQPDPSIATVTAICRRIAANYRSIRADIKPLDIRQPAKRQIRLGYAEEAASWEARATLWEAVAAGDPDADGQTIQVHVDAAIAAYRSAHTFLPSLDDYADRYAQT